MIQTTLTAPLLDRTDDFLKITHFHNAGFFSNCSVMLTRIVEFFNQKRRVPSRIDKSGLFINYKTEHEQGDITDFFFKRNEGLFSLERCNFHFDTQFEKYTEIKFDSICPFIKKYFSPSDYINNLVSQLEVRYNLDHDNICSVFYRGNDKVGETGIADYENFFTKAEEILQKNLNIKFLIQTDELEFAAEFKQRFLNSFFFEEISMINRHANSAVHHSLPRDERKGHASCFLAAVIAMSKTKHLITYSGNCGLWTILYRGNAENIHQYLNHKNFEGWT